MIDQRCPDCAVQMEEVTPEGRTHKRPLTVKTGEKRDGIVGKLGVNKRYDVLGAMCPECGLVRLYAHIDD